MMDWDCLISTGKVKMTRSEQKRHIARLKAVSTMNKIVSEMNIANVGLTPVARNIVHKQILQLLEEG